MITYNYTDNKPSVKAKIYNKSIRPILDTRKKISVIEFDIVKSKNKIMTDRSAISVRCSNESQIYIRRKTTLEATIGKKRKMIKFQVIERVLLKLIGEMNLLNAFSISLQEPGDQGVSKAERDICSNDTDPIDHVFQVY